MGVLIITHYQRILHLVKPDFVHVMYEGRIVKQGGPELVATARGARLRLDPRGGRGGRVGAAEFPMATASVTSPAGSRSIDEIRAEFPILERRVHGQPLAYLDNGATAQKPLR